MVDFRSRCSTGVVVVVVVGGIIIFTSCSTGVVVGSGRIRVAVAVVVRIIIFTIVFTVVIIFGSDWVDDVVFVVVLLTRSKTFVMSRL